ncbi:MAG: mannitol dehydrogenase family protein [Pseudomonadota bacterium]
MPRLLHLGLGNFHRAHQAWYTARAGGWQITGIVMGNVELYDAMNADGGYTLGIRGPDGLAAEWIDIHDRLILARRDGPAVIDAFIDPDLHVVTLTITEKGYCLSPETGALDLGHPLVRADLADTVTTAIGLLTHGLARRADAGFTPLTVVSCDNLSGNGRTLAAAVKAFAEAARVTTDPATRFPDTMVDRITPATTDDMAAEFAAAASRAGTVPVLTEAFSEWVIEDDFAGPRPAWERVGAEFVADVAPYEMRKLRLLNAAHSYLAYAGLLAGHRYVHQAMADPTLRAGVDRLWTEATATLPDAVLPTATAYRAALADRFAVAEMRHSLAQIAMDGSLKLRERLVPLVLAQAPVPQATEAIAAWIVFIQDAHLRGVELADANAADIRNHVAGSASTRALCANLAGLVGLGDAPDGWLDDLAALVAKLGAHRAERSV